MSHQKVAVMLIGVDGATAVKSTRRVRRVLKSSPRLLHQRRPPVVWRWAVSSTGGSAANCASVAPRKWITASPLPVSRT